MNKDIAKSTEIFFDLVAGLEPRLATLHDWFFELVNTIDKWSNSEGNQGIKRAKDILSQGLLAVLGEETETLRFVSSSSGIPTLVQPLVHRAKQLKLDRRLLSGILSLTRITDLWTGRPQDSTVLKQLEIIQSSKLPKTAIPVIEEFRQFLASFLNTFPDSPIVKAFNKSLKLTDADTAMYSESRGPNGALTANSHKDIVSLEGSITSDGKSMLTHITKLQEEIAKCSPFSFRSSTRFSEAVLEYQERDTWQVASCPGKLNYIPEKAGKIRVIAQPDYHSQVSMRPIHRWLSDVLRAIPADCTYNQGSAIPKIGKWQLDDEYLASFDHSSCTDLFPFECQLVVLESRFGSSLASSVRTVMSDREWEIKLPSGTTRKVRWSVGQPMGMYGSWPLMALTHHLIVQFSHWRASGRTFSKKGPFNKYVICGDDIVIGDKSVADSYRHVVKLLGMKINTSKSHISGKGTSVSPVSEFTKIIVWKGQPLFPIRPNMVLTSVKDWRYAVPLFIDIAQCDGFNARLKFIHRVIKKHYSTRSKFLIPLLTIPQEFGGVGYRDSESLRQKFQLISARQIHPWLLFLAIKIRSGLMLENRVMECAEATVLEKDIYRNHPQTVYRKRVMDSQSFLRSVQDYVPSIREILCDIVDHGLGAYSRFLIPVNTNEVLPYWDDSQDKSLLHERTLWERALRKPVILPAQKAYTLESLQPGPMGIPLVASLIDRYSEMDQKLRSRQCDLVQSYIMGWRSNKRERERLRSSSRE